MAGPITWRNVDAANPALAGAALGAATQTTNGAFDIFSRLIQQRQGIDQANAAAIDDANKQVYLDRLASAKTPEELAALQASGQLDTLRQSLTATARAAVRGADEARTTAVRQNTTAENAFNDQLLARKEAPLLAQYNTLVASGKAAEAAAFQAANAGLVRDWSGALQKGYDTGLGRTRDARTEAVAVAAQPNLIAAERFKTATQAQRDALGVQALNIQGGTQTAQQQALSDAQELRRLETVRAQEVQDNAAHMAVVGSLHKRVASAAGINVVNSQGYPDFANMSPAQIVAFDTKAKEMGIPTSAVVVAGDTARGDAFFRRVVESGKFSPHIIAANEQALRSSVNSSPAPVVGNDAAALARATAQTTVGFDRQDASNWYAPSSPDARRQYDELAVKLPDILKSMPAGVWFGDNQKDLPALQGLLGEIASVGIRRKDGVYVTPSANDVLRFVRSEEGGFRDAKRAEDIKDRLTEWVNSPEGIKMAQQGLESQMYRDKQKMLQIQRDLLNPPAPAKK